MENLVDNYLAQYSGKRVLITGDTGFKGSWLSLWLHDLGAEVCGYALPPKRENDHYVLLGLDQLIQHVDGDIRDLEHLLNLAENFQPEYLFHLAAQALVLDSYEDPKLTFDTNVGGSVNVLELCRRVKSIKTLIFVTTDKCYANEEWTWGYRENDRLGGKDPYSASKAAAELAFAAYRESFFINYNTGAASVRAGNVIGGGDRSPNRLVPDCIAALEDKQVIEIRNPEAVRPWQHVLDPLHGYLFLAAKLRLKPEKYSGPWNFGPENCAMRQVEELARLTVSNWGAGGLKLNDSKKDKALEAALLCLNCDKAYHQLGWRPYWGFETAVEKTVQWYKKAAAGVNPLSLSRHDIAAFTEGFKSK